MGYINENERSHQSDLISRANGFLQNVNLEIKWLGAENSISNDETSSTLFPDVLLYSDFQKQRILQGWELKMPDTPITDTNLIENAKTKAQMLNTNSFFLWNFKEGVLYKKNSSGIYAPYKSWSTKGQINNREDVANKRELWFGLIKQILLELDQFFKNGIISGAAIEDILSDNLIDTILNRNIDDLANKLRDEATADSTIDARITDWWLGSKEDFQYEKNDANAKFKARAKIILLSWFNRIIFGHILKSERREARAIETIDESTSPAEAAKIFTSITADCDFYNIFALDDLSTLIPQNVWKDLVELNQLFVTNRLIFNNHTLLQNILKNTITRTKREISGQFATPPILADILCQLTVENWHESIIDPCCGTGTIPHQAMLLREGKRIRVKDNLSNLWASDKHQYPLQITSLALTKPNSINIPHLIFQSNAFDLEPGISVQIIDPETGEKLQRPLPKFKYVISNLPFIKNANRDSVDRAHCESIKEQFKQDYNINLSSKADLYSFLTLHLSSILEEDGRLGVITSNSWLGTVWGESFLEALNVYYDIEQIHKTVNGRWFYNADVLATILILRRKDNFSSKSDMSENESVVEDHSKTFKEEVDEEEKTCQFITWKKSLSELKENPSDKDLLIAKSNLKTNCENDVLRILNYSRQDIDSLNEYSLSPNVFFYDISWLIDIIPLLNKTGDFLEVFRGSRRGWDALFYPSSSDEDTIEDEYLSDVLKNPKKLHHYMAKPDAKAFVCSKSMEELKKLKHQGAIAWIKRFENATNQKGKLLPEVLKRSNLEWYELPTSEMADFVTSINPDDRLFVSRFENRTFINQRLIGFRTTEDVDADLIHALLNTTLSMFFIEASGFGRAQGALDLNSQKFKKFPILNPEIVSSDDRKNILEAFDHLKACHISDVENELFMNPTREHFDRVVFEAYGLDSDLYQTVVRNSLWNLFRDRKEATR